MHGESTDYDTESDQDMERVLMVMLSLMALQPPTAGSGAGFVKIVGL